MDPTALLDTNSGEVREPLTVGGSTCPPPVISSLRQLQIVTEAGSARRRRRRAYWPLQRDVPSVWEGTSNMSRIIAGWGTNSSVGSISGGSSRGHRVLVPYAMLRKIHGTEVSETESELAEDAIRERGRRFPHTGNYTTDVTTEVTLQSKAKLRRLASTLMGGSLGKESRKEGGKAFTLVEVPVRAPTQKTAGGSDESSDGDRAIDVPQKEGALEPQAIRDCRRPEMWGADGARDVDGKSRTKRADPSSARVHGIDRTRHAFCSLSHGAAQCTGHEPDGGRPQKYYQGEIMKQASTQEGSNRSGSGTVLAMCRWGCSRTGGITLHEKDNMGRLGQLREKESHPVRGHEKGGATCDMSQTIEASSPGAVKIESNGHNNTAKQPQLLLTSDQAGKEETQDPMRHAGGDYRVSQVGACHDQQKSQVAVTVLDSQPERNCDAQISDGAADNSGRLSIAPVLGTECANQHVCHRLLCEGVVLPPARRQPVPPLFEKQTAGKTFPHALSRDRISPPDGAVRTGDNCNRNNWPTEQDTWARRVLTSSEETGSLARAKDGDQGKCDRHVSERRDTDKKEDFKKESSPAHSDVGIKQEKSSTSSSSEDEEGSEQSDVPTSARSLPYSSGTQDSRNAVSERETGSPQSAGEDSGDPPSRDSDRANFIFGTPASVSLYYHVQETSPRPRERVPMHNAAGAAQQSNRLYPVIKGVSRDNAKRRWAVYWKGSRRYFYDKLSEDCYRAYQQAVNFRRYSSIQHASRGKSFHAVEVPPGCKKTSSSLTQLRSISANTVSSTEAAALYRCQTEGISGGKNVQSNDETPRESKASHQDCSPPISTSSTKAPVQVPRSQVDAADGLGQLSKQAESQNHSERTYQAASSESLTAADGGAANAGHALNLRSREEYRADSVINMYKTALLIVLQDLEVSLSALHASPARQNTPSNRPGEGGANLQSRCSAASTHLRNSAMNSQFLRSEENAVPSREDAEQRLYPFLLLVVDWHIETVRRATTRSELQPLLDVFSTCFQHLLLPRNAPRAFRRTIYEQLIKLHTTQALYHLADA